MNKTNIALGVALVAVVIAIGAFVRPAQAPDQGGATRFPNSDLSAKSLATTNGNLTVVNLTATSTANAGNIQTTATSSATSICLVPSTLGATSSFNGTVYFKYGTCPF